jgi:hypothetical protein
VTHEPLNVRVARAIHPDATFERRRTHAPTCPYSSKAAAKGNAVADCNCLEDAEDWWMTTRSENGDWRTDSMRRVPPYGEDSPEGNAATMPFLRHVNEAHAQRTGPVVLYNFSRPETVEGRGATWGEALCNLVLALREAGRLERIQ